MAQTDFDYFVIWVRGVPWQQNENDLSTWFESKGVNTYDGCYGVYFVYNRNGVFRGDCYVLLNSDDDMQRSLQLDKQQFGERYLEIRQSTWGDLEGALAEFRRGPDESVMKIRGLPYSAREEDLRNYFEGYNLVDVIMCLNDTGRASGDAFVRFGSKADVKRAFEKHKQKLGESNVDGDKGTDFRDWVLGERVAGEGVQFRRKGYVELFLASEGLIDLYNERGFIVTGGGYSSEGGGGGGFRERGGYSGGGGDDYRDSGRGGGGRGDRRGGRGGFRGDRGGGGGGGFRGGDRGGGRNGYDRNGGGGDRFDRGGGGFDRRGRGGGGGYGGDRSGGGGGGGGCSSQRYDPYSAPQYGGGHGGSARRGGGGTSLFIRGLPFNVSEREIETFFEPIPVSSVTLNASDRGSSSDGTAWAEFNSRSDAEQAMQRDRGKIQHRYVELFWHDPTKKRRTPDSGGGGGGIGGGGGYGMADSGGAPPPPPMTMQYAAAPPPQYQMGAPPMIPYGQAGYVMPMMATGVPQAAPQYDYGNAGGSYGGGMPPPHQPGAGW